MIQFSSTEQSTLHSMGPINPKESRTLHELDYDILSSHLWTEKQSGVFQRELETTEKRVKRQK